MLPCDPVSVLYISALLHERHCMQTLYCLKAAVFPSETPCLQEMQAAHKDTAGYHALLGSSVTPLYISAPLHKGHCMQIFYSLKTALTLPKCADTNENCLADDAVGFYGKLCKTSSCHDPPYLMFEQQKPDASMATHTAGSSTTCCSRLHTGLRWESRVKFVVLQEMKP